MDRQPEGRGSGRGRGAATRRTWPCAGFRQRLDLLVAGDGGPRSPRSDPRQVRPDQKWIGYPTTDETGCPDGVGRFNHFEHGSIYWTPETGAHEVHGAIRDKWAELGWERSKLRYPVTDEHDIPGGRASNFQGGEIQWTQQGGPVVRKSQRLDD